MFRKSLIFGFLLVVVVIVIKFAVAGMSRVEFSEFKPVCAIFLLDVSASNREMLWSQQQTILKIGKKLDSEDHAKIYVVTEDAYEAIKVDTESEMKQIATLLGEDYVSDYTEEANQLKKN